MKKQKNDNEKQIGVYLFQVVSIFVLFFCVWLLTREKTYNEIDVNKVAQNLVELMPDTVVSENDMVVKERFGLEANAFNALVYYGPDSNMDAAELLLVDMKDTSQKKLLCVQSQIIIAGIPINSSCIIFAVLLTGTVCLFYIRCHLIQ